MDEMALSWIKKDGKINDTVHARVLDLVRGEYENEDEFIEDLDETISYERDDELEEDDNGEEGGCEKGEMAGGANAHESQHKDPIGTNTVGNILIKATTEETNQNQGAVEGGTSVDSCIIEDSVREDWGESGAICQDLFSKSGQSRKRRRI
jgi:hypothetical protein